MLINHTEALCGSERFVHTPLVVLISYLLVVLNVFYGFLRVQDRLVNAL